MGEILSPEVLQSFAPPTIRSVADWAEQRAFLPPGDSASGKWHNRPIQVEIQKAMTVGNRLHASGARVREVVIVKGARLGLTKCLYNAIGYHIEHNPSMVGMYLPDPSAVKNYSGGPWVKWLEAQPSLRGLVSSEISSDGKSSSTRKLFPGGMLMFLSASLGRDLASYGWRLILSDEVDLFPDNIKNEGNVVKLIRNRAREFSDAIIVWNSTPRSTYENSKIWKLYSESDQRRFLVRCKSCGTHQYLDLKQFRVKEPYQDSGFECIKCGHLMTESEKQQMIDEGYWRPNKKKKDSTPGIAGFYLPSFYAIGPTTTWPMLARARDQAGYDKEALTVWLNTVAGLPSSSARESAVKPHEIIGAAKSSGYVSIQSPEQPIPDPISLITYGCDVQSSKTKGRLEISVWGFSRTHDYLLNTFVVEGDPESDSLWEGLKAVSDVTYVTENKKKQIRPHYVFIDCGDGKLTNRVYTVCRSNYTWHPVRGQSMVGKPHVARLNVPLNDANRLHQIYYSVQVSIAKDLFSEEIKRFVDSDPDCRLRLPEDLSEEVAISYTSEYRQVKPGNPPKVLWVPYSSQAPNHIWDSSIYALAAKTSLIQMYEPEVIWTKLENDCQVQSDKGGESSDSIYRQRRSSW